MTTLNAKANTAYNELIAEYEREHPDGVWLGFDHQRDAFETGYETGHGAARPVVDREALCALLRATRVTVNDEWHPTETSAGQIADAVLALLNTHRTN